MAMIVCRSSTQPQNTWFEILHVRRTRNSCLKSVKVVIYGRLQDSLLKKLFHLSPLGSLPALHIWRHLVTKVGTTITLPELQRVISVPFLSGLFFMPNWPNEWTQTFISYALSSSFSASHVLSWDSVHIGCRSRSNSQNSEFCVSYV